MRVLSLWQPWASLIAVGAKTIETRGWTTDYRGPLLIHAAKRTPDDIAALDPISTALEVADVDPRAVLDWKGQRWVERCIDSPRTWGRPMPLGAVVATCTLADVVPIGGPSRCPEVREDIDGLWLYPAPGRPAQDISGQHPYGDFTPGRYAWLLADVRALPEPIPAKGRQRLWTPDADLIAAVPA